MAIPPVKPIKAVAKISDAALPRITSSRPTRVRRNRRSVASLFQSEAMKDTRCVLAHSVNDGKSFRSSLSAAQRRNASRMTGMR